jgi:methylation protein EvaC
MACRITSEPLSIFLDLGRQPLGNGFYQKSDSYRGPYYDLRVGISEQGFIQIENQPNADQMFHDAYPFFSGTSARMRQHFANTAAWLVKKLDLTKDAKVCEVGCNDGVFLAPLISAGFSTYGFEPASNVASVAAAQGAMVLEDFFSYQAAQDFLNKLNGDTIDLVFAANVLCHIPDILDVFRGVASILSPKGHFVFEDPYWGDIVSRSSYDQIYDEHVHFFSVNTVKTIANLCDLALVDVEKLETHGGSMRYFLTHKTPKTSVSESVQNWLMVEKMLGVHTWAVLENFASNVATSRSLLLSLIQSKLDEGKRIAGFGATSKSTTILNYCGINSDHIDYVCDNTPLKQGKYCPGSGIPIVPEDSFLKSPPDYALLFAWNHQAEILKAQAWFSKSGRNWITHVPVPRVF